MTKGICKWFDSKKGFGFITQEDGTDVFVHHTGIDGTGFKTLNEGDVVEFEVVSGPKGNQAIKVQKV